MDKYEKVRVLGSGAFGRAWLVRHKATQDLYVMKEMKSSNKLELEEALQEAKIHASLRHPYIIRYREVFRGGSKTVYIVMEYAGGGDLSALIKRNKLARKPFSREQVLRWLAQMGEALRYLHTQGKIHRDVKAANMFLDSQGNIKLGDFGIARVLEDNAARMSARTCVTPVGTPMMMAPEMASAKAYGQKVDVWALGCVLYELVQLKPPFIAQSMDNLMRRIRKGKFDQNYPDTVASDIQTLIADMFAVDPDQRPNIHTIMSAPLLAPFVQETEQMVLDAKDAVDDFDVVQDDAAASGAKHQTVAGFSGLAPLKLAHQPQGGNVGPVVKIPETVAKHHEKRRSELRVQQSKQQKARGVRRQLPQQPQRDPQTEADAQSAALQDVPPQSSTAKGKEKEKQAKALQSPSQPQLSKTPKQHPLRSQSQILDGLGGGRESLPSQRVGTLAPPAPSSRRTSMEVPSDGSSPATSQPRSRRSSLVPNPQQDAAVPRPGHGRGVGMGRGLGAGYRKGQLVRDVSDGEGPVPAQDNSSDLDTSDVNPSPVSRPSRPQPARTRARQQPRPQPGKQAGSRRVSSEMTRITEPISPPKRPAAAQQLQRGAQGSDALQQNAVHILLDRQPLSLQSFDSRSGSQARSRPSSSESQRTVQARRLLQLEKLRSKSQYNLPSATDPASFFTPPLRRRSYDYGGSMEDLHGHVGGKDLLRNIMSKPSLEVPRTPGQSSPPTRSKKKPMSLVELAQHYQDQRA
eukprot:m.185162 g.185162  ORF g.185162 m.185162 type:complete len:745 (-) comp14725_c3_seq1:487-2721(-)